MPDTETKILLGQVKAENLETRRVSKELSAKTDVLIGILSDLRDAVIRMTGEAHDLAQEIRLLRSQLSADTAPIIGVVG